MQTILHSSSLAISKSRTRARSVCLETHRGSCVTGFVDAEKICMPGECVCVPYVKTVRDICVECGGIKRLLGSVRVCVWARRRSSRRLLCCPRQAIRSASRRRYAPVCTHSIHRVEIQAWTVPSLSCKLCTYQSRWYFVLLLKLQLKCDLPPA